MKFLYKKSLPNKQFKINLHELYLKLNDLCIFLNCVYDINYGGCCYLAYLIAKSLEKTNFKFSVVVYRCTCDDFYDLDCGHYHYAIKLGDDIINGYEEDDYKIFDNVSSTDLLDHYKECDWNDYYRTRKNALIKQVVNNFYKDFIHDLREEWSENCSK